MFSKITKVIRLAAELPYVMRPLLRVPTARTVEACIADVFDLDTHKEPTTTLDLGCGRSPQNPFSAGRTFGVDIRSMNNPDIRVADLTISDIPFDSGSFDFVTAYDFLEHIPRVVYCPQQRFPFVELMNEVYRVLKPGGIFLSQTPIFPYSQAFQDPTHVNIMSAETLDYYFGKDDPVASMYGFNGTFDIVKQRIIKPYLVAILKKVATKSV